MHKLIFKQTFYLKNKKGGKIMRNLRSSEDGLSLIEVIVSIAILGILIVPIFGLLNMNLKFNMQSRNQFIATNLASNEIEELKFSNDKSMIKKTSYKDGFKINAVKEIIDRKDTFKNDTEETMKLNDIYKLVIEVEKDGKIIESLFTYQGSLRESE